MPRLVLAAAAILAATSPGKASGATPSIEIAPGVKMPLLNAGIGNRSIWVEAGGRGLDTAFIYGDDDQKSAGTTVAKSGVPREELFITTKVPCCPSNFVQCTFSDTHANLQHDLDMLGVGQVDVMLLHWPCETFEQTLRAYKAIEDFYDAGKARAIGVSNFNSTLLSSFVKAVKVKPAVNQVGFSVGGHFPDESPWGRDDATLAESRKLGVHLTAYSPLGGITKVDVFHDATVLAIAAQHNRSAAQVALRWLTELQIPLITTTSSIAHAQSDLDIFDFTLSKEEMQQLSAVKPDDLKVSLQHV
mmetsp:Transcript_34832/g.81345  ORF Transcript_34832/g.81345 Transcript_34832/m.81345 type:complete len:303 (+) Transcript_34832:112-1020(+)